MKPNLNSTIIGSLNPTRRTSNQKNPTVSDDDNYHRTNERIAHGNSLRDCSVSPLTVADYEYMIEDYRVSPPDSPGSASQTFPHEQTQITNSGAHDDLPEDVSFYDGSVHDSYPGSHIAK